MNFLLHLLIFFMFGTFDPFTRFSFCPYANFPEAAHSFIHVAPGEPYHSSIFTGIFDTFSLTVFWFLSLQGQSMPATEGPLPPLTPRRSGQRATPVCSSSLHQSLFRLQPAPESPLAPLMGSLGTTALLKARVALILVSVRSSLGMPPLPRLDEHRTMLRCLT